MKYFFLLFVLLYLFVIVASECPPGLVDKIEDDCGHSLSRKYKDIPEYLDLKNPAHQKLACCFLKDLEACMLGTTTGGICDKEIRETIRQYEKDYSKESGVPKCSHDCGSSGGQERRLSLVLPAVAVLTLAFSYH